MVKNGDPRLSEGSVFYLYFSQKLEQEKEYFNNRFCFAEDPSARQIGREDKQGCFKDADRAVPGKLREF